MNRSKWPMRPLSLSVAVGGIALAVGLVLFLRSDAGWYWMQAAEYRGLTGLLEHRAGRLKKGMSPAEVERVMGLPSNSDREHVWLWLLDGSALPEGMKWGEAIAEWAGSRVSGYLLFVEGRLVSDYVRYMDTSPWQLYCSMYRCDLATAKAVLGPGGRE